MAMEKIVPACLSVGMTGAFFAELWLQKRAEIGHPLGVADPQPAVDPAGPPGSPSLEPAELLVEIGCEELPPADIQAATQQLRSFTHQMLTSFSTQKPAVHFEREHCWKSIQDLLSL